jgi:hypothetical protein
MNHDTIQIDVPKSALVDAFLEKVARASLERDFPMTEMQSRAAPLPAIGAAWPHFEGLYAGITIHQDMPHALVLLPGEDNLPWEKAKAWASERDGMLPSRFDGLVLFKNLKAQFKEAWYWTSDEYAPDADYAWIQDFDYGVQVTSRKSSDYRCRAVRRVAI